MPKVTIQFDSEEADAILEYLDQGEAIYTDVTKTLLEVLTEASLDNTDSASFELSQNPEHPKNKKYREQIIKIMKEKHKLIDSLL